MGWGLGGFLGELFLDEADVFEEVAFASVEDVWHFKCINKGSWIIRKLQDYGKYKIDRYSARKCSVFEFTKFWQILSLIYLFLHWNAVSGAYSGQPIISIFIILNTNLFLLILDECLWKLRYVRNTRPYLIFSSDGANCTVKKAVRKDTRQVFAAKLCETGFLAAKNEIQMLVRLDHPNIVNIYEVYE